MANLYTPSQFLSLLKKDAGIKGIPLPISDDDLYEHFCESALKEFSVRSPRKVKFLMNDNERLDKGVMTASRAPIRYKIPKTYYLDSVILGVTNVDVSKPLGYSDLYVPQGMWASPDSVIGAIADVKSAAAVASAMGKAMTFEFEAPDIILMYNGWSSGVYEVEMMLLHDKSLATIHPTQFSSLRRLAMLDMRAYLYNELSRIDNLDVGIGTIDLKTDRWADAEQQMNDLLNLWDEDGNLDVENIRYF